MSTHELEATNETRSMMKGSYNDVKLDKSSELNSNMTINEGSKDEYESAIHSVGSGGNS